MSIDSAYRDLLPPRLARAYDQLMAARAGRKVELTSFEVDAKYGRLMGECHEIPDAFVAIKRKGARPERQEPGRCFQHLADLKTLFGPKFPWYDPARPGRPGFFVAGSFATPCWDHHVTKMCVWTLDENGKGVERLVDFRVPRGRGDVDLFIAGAGDAVDMAAEHLVTSVMLPNEKNPFMRCHPVDVCEHASCQAHYRRHVGGGSTYSPANPKGARMCASCQALNFCSTDASNVYDYVAKHVVAFTMGSLNIEVVTRVYSTPEKCPALFDLTYDGGIYMGGDDVRFLDISLYQQAHSILLSTPFSGSSTQELRHVKKIEAYDLDLVVPGLRWDPGMPAEERGLTVVRDVLRYRACVDELGAITGDVDVTSKRLYRAIFKSGARTLKTIMRHFVEDGARSYSFVPGCTGSRVYHRNSDGVVVGPVLLCDVPGSDVHVGAFSFTPPAEFVGQWHMALAAPKPDPAPKPPKAPVDARTVRQASKGFAPGVRNLITSFDVRAVVGASRVVLRPGPPGSIDVGIAFRIADVDGAQIWNLDVSKGVAVIRCRTHTGIYVQGDSVCMGSQTHYHAVDNIPFSLSAMVTSLAERPGVILAGDKDHLTSLGVMHPIADVEDVLKAHADALGALESDDWVLDFDVPAE